MSKVKVDMEVDLEGELRGKEKRKTRGKLFLALALAVVVAGGGYYAYDTLYASRHAITDNAYVGADIAPITPLVAAPVGEVLVGETQHVKAGDVLVRLDDTDAQLRLAAAEAAYQSAIRHVKSFQANDRNLKAQVAGRLADMARARAGLASAQAVVDKARVDFERRTALAGNGSVSGDELTAADAAYQTAQASLDAARAGLDAATAAREAAEGAQAANAALISGVSVEENPEVLAARAARDQAKVDLERTVIRAPLDGVVSQRRVQVGQRVQPGMTLMVVVPVAEAYVDANFKEVQLARVRKGQEVTLHSDLYGSDVAFSGHVVGFSGGTGSAFSMVPAQNATGNWIKVVQRLPVRIALDPGQLEEHPLEVGLSMTADIHLED
ncbi:HlyD family efflux transporter periplasmic adaptor subunit [Breoghania sp.]|uniref:HlyD family secretion protein n=1 Tax=Breoghania sp. TaxID=2065378 RepID=UPI002AA6BDB1|nr:HlyD family efflux transporter periplasmic adaptor subunit [Breoghania sp.]